MPNERPRKDAGSRSLLDVLRKPGPAFRALFRNDLAPPTDDDLRAVAGPEGRVITCFIQSSFEPFPMSWKQGGLHLAENTARWSPGLRLRGGGILLPSPPTVWAVRKAVGAERLRIKSAFTVIEVDTPDGSMRLAVPNDSVTLVTGVLSTTR